MKQGNRGMTLIEVAVAVSVLATMGLLAYGGLAITIRSQRETGQLQERYHTARITLERMKNEISQAFLSLHQAEDKRTITFFDGEDDHITFVTAAHEPIQKNAHESDQLEVEYRLDSVDGDRVIVRRVKQHVDDSPGSGGTEEVVARGVKDLEFEYYDKESEDWKRDWDVEIDDALEKRAQLQMIRQLADQLKGEADTRSGGDPLTTTVADMAADRLADSEQGDTLEEMFLPSRVKIRIVLRGTDDNNDRKEYPLETQVEIPMTEPLWY